MEKSTAHTSPSKGVKRKNTENKKAPPEKRQARFRSSASNAVQERIARALTERLFLIHREPLKEGPAPSQKFVVLGSTGNVYNVCIDKVPSCTCPDHENGNLCKHVLFIYLKVLKVPSGSNLIYQKALLSSELTGIFASAPTAPATALASAAVRRTYSSLAGVKEDDLDSTQNVKRKPIEGDCPVCCEEMHDRAKGKAEDAVWCSACGNNVHALCFEKWSLNLRKQRKDVTCVLCRSVWVPGRDGKDKQDDVVCTGGNAPPKGMSNEGYLNLSKFQPGTSRERPEYEDPYEQYHHRSMYY